jgi:hypothetical protein
MSIVEILVSYYSIYDYLIATKLQFYGYKIEKKRFACTKHKLFKNTVRNKTHDTSSPPHRDINPSLHLRKRPVPTEPTAIVKTKE